MLLSGATGGLGRAIAEELAANGANLVLSSRKQAELEDLRRSLPGGEERHEVIVADLAEEGAPEKLMQDAGDVDVLVANAALPASGKLDDFSQWELARAVQGQPGGADPDDPRARPEAAEEGRGSPRLHLLPCRTRRHRPLIAVFGDQVRPPRLRVRPPRGPGAEGGWRVDRLARLRPRGGDVRRGGNQAPARDGDDDAEEGGRVRSFGRSVAIAARSLLPRGASAPSPAGLGATPSGQAASPGGESTRRIGDELAAGQADKR